MSHMHYILAIDTGSSSSKLALFDTQGTLTALVRKAGKVMAEEKHNAVREYDPLLWWESTAQGMQELLQTSKVHPSQILAVGLSGQIGTHILIDQHHRTLMSAISWQDGRAADEARWLMEHYGSLDESLGMHLPPGTAWPIPRLLWLKKHMPQLFEKPFTLLQTKDYLALKLTGELKTDVLSLRGLVHPLKKTLDPLVSHTILGIGDLIDRLPPFQQATDVLGSITEEAAQATGLLAGTPVITGCGDFHASLVGTGIVDGSHAFNITGTSDHIGLLVPQGDKQAYDPRLGRYPSVVEGWDIWYGATSAGGGSLQWFLDSFGTREKNQTIKAYIEGMLKEIEGPSGMLYLPYLNGERAPLWDAQARGTFFGFSAAHTKAHFLKAVLEGVCFSLKDCYAIMEEKHPVLPRIRVSGAAGADHLWNQMKADILQTELQGMECQETSSLGAAMLAAVGIGAYSTIQEAAEAMVRTTTLYTPRKMQAYETMFTLYRNLYESLKPRFEELAQLRSNQ